MYYNTYPLLQRNPTFCVEESASWQQMAGRIRILSAHSGEDFERGRVGHRNGEAPVGAEPSLSDGVQPEEDIARGAPGTGLGTAACNRVRKPAQSMPARMGPVWLTVNVTGKERDTNPDVQCKD